MVKEKSNSKKKGQIFTPPHIVREMLNYCAYNSPSILTKHIIDNSCGNGAFLIEIVERYCKYFLTQSQDIDKLKRNLETYIHGIEIDTFLYNECLQKLNGVTKKYELPSIQWNIYNCDALQCHSFYNRMDFVVGNPPYIRIHDLNNDIAKALSFMRQGMTDLYIAFFEIGFHMLSPTGKMCLITPSSWFSSTAGKLLRTYIYEHKNLKGIIDLEHYQPFKATTYTAISLFDNSKIFNEIEYSIYNGKEINFIEKLPYNKIKMERQFYFSPSEDLERLHCIKNANNNILTTVQVEVKNGFATLADQVFIGNFSFEKNCIDVLKASTGQWLKCVYPYTPQGTPDKHIQLNSPVWNYLEQNRERLLSRSIQNKDEWYLFGRTQAINDVYKNKIAINTLIKDFDSIKLIPVEKGKGVYSGLYILTDIPFDKIYNTIYSRDFIHYIKALKKYKNGGYYTFSSSDLEKYLNFRLNEANYEQ